MDGCAGRPAAVPRWKSAACGDLSTIPPDGATGTLPALDFGASHHSGPHGRHRRIATLALWTKGCRDKAINVTCFCKRKAALGTSLSRFLLIPASMKTVLAKPKGGTNISIR